MSIINPKIKIGRKLRTLREKNGLDQKTVANFLEVDEQHISEIENDERNISTVVIERFCELYGCSSRDLFDQDIPTSIEYSQPLSEYAENLSEIAVVNRIALNLLEMQRLQIAGDKFIKDSINDVYDPNNHVDF